MIPQSSLLDNAGFENLIASFAESDLRSNGNLIISLSLEAKRICIGYLRLHQRLLAKRLGRSVT